MDHPDFSDTKPQQELNYLWSTLQAAGVAGEDARKAYVTVREALNDRYLRPDVARLLRDVAVCQAVAEDLTSGTWSCVCGASESRPRCPVQESA